MKFDRPVIHEDGKKAVIYLRVSTEEQVDNFSLGSQEDICRKEAEKRGYEVVEVFREEGRSAKTILGRPVLISLLEYCRKNKTKVHAVFAYRLDRISRQTADYLAIRKKLLEQDITIISATEPTGDSPTEKLVETILAGFAQLDNDIRSERARNGLRARYMSGLISGKPPLGYKFQAGFAVKDPETWDKVKRAWELMATGTKSTRDLGKIMSDWGLREIHGKLSYELRPQSVCRIFRLKFYAGILTSKTYPDEIKGQHVPMITEELFYKVQALLDGRGPNRGVFVKRTFINEAFPLRRIVKCGKCGAGLTGYWSTGKMGVRYAYYSCGMKCNYKCIPVKEVEDSVIDMLKDITPKEEALKLFINSVYKAYHQRLSRLNKTKSEANQEIERLKLLRKSLVEKNLSGVYSDEIFKEQSAIIEDKMIKSQISKEDSIINKYNIDALTSFIKTLLADLGEAYKRSSIPQLKILLSSVFEDNLTWDYNGTPNSKISPLYQYIRDFSEHHVPSGAGNGIRTRDLLVGNETLYH
ncbi:MAG: site-specific recombinase [Microgenomates group bacterium Gr01-1014_5]|nr:MAG: site-specific recombinase [Microgenomates group bacterium Gr01-1014_5]